jgi:predicted DNA-binding protein
MVSWRSVRRIAVWLPDELDARLRRAAARRGVTVSALVREAIAGHLDVGSTRRLLAAGARKSGRSDVAGRVEEILASEWRR